MFMLTSNDEKAKMTGALDADGLQFAITMTITTEVPVTEEELVHVMKCSHEDCTHFVEFTPDEILPSQINCPDHGSVDFTTTTVEKDVERMETQEKEQTSAITLSREAVFNLMDMLSNEVSKLVSQMQSHIDSLPSPEDLQFIRDTLESAQSDAENARDYATYSRDNLEEALDKL